MPPQSQAHPQLPEPPAGEVSQLKPQHGTGAVNKEFLSIGKQSNKTTNPTVSNLDDSLITRATNIATNIEASHI